MVPWLGHKSIDPVQDVKCPVRSEREYVIPRQVINVSCALQVEAYVRWHKGRERRKQRQVHNEVRATVAGGVTSESLMGQIVMHAYVHTHARVCAHMADTSRRERTCNKTSCGRIATDSR